MNKPRRLFLLGLVVSLPVTPACNSSSSSGDSGPSAADVESACTLDAQSYCDKRKTCWPEGVSDFRFQRDWGTLQACVDQRKQSCLGDLHRKQTGLTTTRVQSCAQALQSQSCENFLAGIALPTSACPPVVGPIDDGTTCVVNNQCKSNYCDRGEDQLCGKCADKGGIGGACDQSSDCAGGLSCLTNPDTLARACMMAGPAAVHARAGEACGGTLPSCDTALACVGTGTMKTCVAQVATAGGACDPGKKLLPDCESATNHLYCNRTTLVCEARKFVAIGQPCNELADGSFAMCSAGGRCVRPKDALTGARPAEGTCVAEANAGQRCQRDASEGPQCQPPLRCVYDTVGAPAGTCLAQDDAMCGKVPGRDGGTD
jgi:hypothetical protein